MYEKNLKIYMNKNIDIGIKYNPLILCFWIMTVLSMVMVGRKSWDDRRKEFILLEAFKADSVESVIARL